MDQKTNAPPPELEPPIDPDLWFDLWIDIGL